MTKTEQLPFPRDFLWGVATSAYQIEGGIDEDGRGPSTWDAFCAQADRVRNGDNGAIATDHRHRYTEDVKLMAELNVRAYRFSIAWPRVQPTGSGAVSNSGLDFYSRLVDDLLARDIVPVVTLYHWDLPLELERAGGWPSRETSHRFGEYAAIVGEKLGDRVARWSTVNEPWCTSMLGYAAGVFAPGSTDPASAVRAAHHLLLGHGLAVDALRSSVRAPGSEIAVSLNPYPVVPASDDPADVDAARRVDAVANRLWYDTILRGAYPPDLVDDLDSVSDFRHVQDGDLEQISRPIDALGINYYRRYHVRHSPGASARPPHSTWPGSNDIEIIDPPGVALTDGDWTIEPDGLTETLLRVRDDYGPIRLYVHENGAAYDTEAIVEGVARDPGRVAFLDAHFRAALRAIDQGVDLRGYFVWSLLDNFEWAEGYAHRFGIVHVDFQTLERTPKSSALYCARVFRDNAISPATGEDDVSSDVSGRLGS